MQERQDFDPRVGEIPWRRAWQLTPVFLPGESLGQRNLVGYSPWGHKVSDMTEATEYIRMQKKTEVWRSWSGERQVWSKTNSKT